MHKWATCTIGLLLVLLLQATPASTAAAAQVTVAPTTGPVGTQFAITGTGFAPDTTVLRRIRSTTSGSRAGVYDDTIKVAPDGTFLLQFDSTGVLDGGYVVQIAASRDDLDRGTLLASTLFTITAGPTPGLPNTGGGHASTEAGSGHGSAPLIVGLLALALTGSRVHRLRRPEA